MCSGITTQEIRPLQFEVVRRSHSGIEKIAVSVLFGPSHVATALSKLCLFENFPALFQLSTSHLYSHTRILFTALHICKQLYPRFKNAFPIH